jgi:hypothetical protein
LHRRRSVSFAHKENPLHTQQQPTATSTGQSSSFKNIQAKLSTQSTTIPSILISKSKKRDVNKKKGKTRMMGQHDRRHDHWLMEEDEVRNENEVFFKSRDAVVTSFDVLSCSQMIATHPKQLLWWISKRTLRFLSRQCCADLLWTH